MLDNRCHLNTYILALHASTPSTEAYVLLQLKLSWISSPWFPASVAARGKVPRIFGHLLGHCGSAIRRSEVRLLLPEWINWSNNMAETLVPGRVAGNVGKQSRSNIPQIAGDGGSTREGDSWNTLPVCCRASACDDGVNWTLSFSFLNADAPELIVEHCGK
jgi:hypothetical protein